MPGLAARAGDGMEITAKQTHRGQYHPYGDTFYEWDVQTAAGREEVAEWCFVNLYTRRLPYYTEWLRNIGYSGEKYGDMGYYFAGYYRLDPIDGGYKFVVCLPYTG